MSRRALAGMLVVLLGITTAACGSRASVEQRALARRASLGLGTTGEAGAGGATASETGADGLSGGDASAASAGGGSAAAGGNPAASGGGAAASAQAPCVNKGATDTGVTPTQITLGNVATLSGPVPGLFQGAHVGAQAAVAYQNSLGGICGRQLKMALRDDQFDSGQNRAQTLDLLKSTFGFLGSFSLYDDAAAAEIGKAGVPDAAMAITDARRLLANNFPVTPQVPGGAQLGPFNYLKERFPDAIKSVGALWADVGSATQRIERGFEDAAKSVGYQIVYSRGYGATETDFTADVVRMRQNGVRMVMLLGADPKATARITASMAQQGFKPDVVFGGAQAYDPATIALGGPAVEGIFIVQSLSMFAGEDAGAVPEVALMNDWVQKVKPGFKTDLFTMYGWAEGRLLFKAMLASGADLTRANVLAQLRQIHPFDAGGLVAPADPAGKVPPVCFLVATIRGGKFVRAEPARGYVCNKGGYYGG